MGRLFGTDGVRGIANVELTCELALAIGRAVASILTDKKDKKIKILIGHDTRISSDMLTSAVISGLCSVGADAVYLGTVSTPAVAFLVKSCGADAGIMISASHNSSKYNGIKVFGADGYKLPDALEDKIEGVVLDCDSSFKVKKERIGRAIDGRNMINDYKSHLLSIPDSAFNGLKIAIDCANGSASATAADVFSSLGASVTTLFDSPDGYNINDGCGSTHIEALRKIVLDEGLDAGFAFDGDADRCLCIDENGEIVDGDHILAMIALDLRQRGLLKNKTVVGTVMTNFGFTRFCNDNGITFLPTKVGDRYVLEEMLLGNFAIGGEQSGHIIFSDHATTGDGQLTAIKVLSLMKRSGKTLSELKSVMKRYPQELINIKVTEEGKLRFYNDPAVQNAIKKAESDLGEEGRIVVRPSGTEPLIRVMTEGEDKVFISRVAQSVADVIRDNLS